ncbi:MAG: zinc ribbon domain-containing protein [Anaerolineaceae bacterium]
MPYYDFRCEQCQKRFEVFLTYTQYGAIEIVCPVCGSTSVRRLIRRVRIGHSISTDVSDFGEDADLAELEQDPRKLGRMMREMGKESGEELGPEFEEVVERLEKGHNPEDIAESLPDFSDVNE